MLLGASALTALVMLATTLEGQNRTTGMDKPRRGDIERHVKTAVARFIGQTKVPGLVLGMIADGKVLSIQGHGSMSPDAGSASADPSTVFHLASLSKPFVATAVMALTEQGKVAVDDPVIKHLPYFRLADERFPQITIRQLLTHVSGLPDVEDYGWAKPEYDENALERYVRSLASLTLIGPPGEKYAYSNIGYEILGDVIAKTSGRSFEAFMADTVFRPLGMNSSTFLLPEVPRGRLAVPSVRNEGGAFVRARHFPYNRAHAPSSTLYSTARDMVRWLETNLAGGVLHGNRILGSDAFYTMFSGGVERASTPIRSIQNLGWSTLVLDGISVHGHGGHDAGFRSMMVFAPEARAAVVVMTNGDAQDVKVDSLGLELLGIVVGKDWHF